MDKNNTIRKGLVIGIILLFIGASVVLGFSINDKDKDRNIIYVNWDGTGDYTTIQEGINVANSGDTVFVYNGTYYENVVVDKSINLTGEDRSDTIIDGGRSGNVVLLSADGVNISGFTIQNAGGGSYIAGINITSSNNIIMDNNISSNNNGGIYIFSINNNNVISGNNVMNNFNAVALRSSTNSTVSNNNIYDNTGEGLAFWNCSSDSILNNTIYSNVRNGIRLDAYGGTTTNNIVMGNNISSNGCNGIWLRCADNNTITGNEIQNSPKGIWFCIYNENICQNNTVYHNNFINNTNNAYDEGINIWYNSTLEEGNYYDDYPGEDNNGDGIGDTPYKVSGGANQDLYPLMYHWGEMPPVAEFTYWGNNLSVLFDAVPSYDRDGYITTWLWDFGDGVEGAGIQVEHVYNEPGTYEVTLTVIDDDGYEGQITKQIEVEDGEYEFETILIIGRITNLNAEGDFITFEAVNIQCITFFPFTFNPYTSGKKITILQDYIGVVGTRFIFALCGASI